MAGVAIELHGLLGELSQPRRSHLVGPTLLHTPSATWEVVAGSAPLPESCQHAWVYNNEAGAIGVVFSVEADPSRFWIVQANRARDIPLPELGQNIPLRIKIL